jgi:hypothetical protein
MTTPGIDAWSTYAIIALIAALAAAAIMHATRDKR